MSFRADLKFWICYLVEKLANEEEQYNCEKPTIELSVLFNKLNAPNVDILEAIAQLKEDGSVVDYDDNTVTFRRRRT